MLYLSPIFLLVISYIFGELILVAMRAGKGNAAEKCVVGSMVLFVSFELFFGVAIKWKIPFHIICNAFSIFILVVITICLLIQRKKFISNLLVSNPVNPAICIHILAILVIQCVCFFILMPDTNGDYTLQTINTTIYTDTIYTYNPLTGDSFNGGYTFRGMVVSLPIFYSYVYSLFGGDVMCFLYRAMPMWTLILSFLCYGLWAKHLFNQDKDIEVKVAIFLSGLGVLNICGMFSKDCIFYNQMFKGFCGETICFAVILPYCVYCIFKMVNTKTNSRWLGILLALLAEVALADFEKGLVPTIACILLFIFIHYIGQLWRWIKCRR